MPRDPFAKERGFTLLELVIVLAIIGMTLAMAVPLLGRHTPALEAAAGELRGVFRDARVTAIAEGRAVAFQGDPNGGYWLDDRHRRLDVAAEVPGGLRVATAAPIAFFPSGGSSGGRVFVDGANGRRELAVDPVTGRARLVR